MIYALCNIGPRENNDDSIMVNDKTYTNTEFYLDEPIYQIGVFDGVGGNNAGNVASNFVANRLSKLKGIFSKEDFASYVININKDLILKAQEKEETNNMASTACYAAFNNGNVFLFNIGDSKIFRFRRGILWQASTDDVPFAGRKHQITACFGINIENDDIHIVEDELRDSDIFILCTDGISDVFTKDEMEEMIISSKGIKELAKRFKEELKSKELTDNYSLIIYNRIGEENGSRITTN